MALNLTFPPCFEGREWQLSCPVEGLLGLRGQVQESRTELDYINNQKAGPSHQGHWAG